VSVAVDSPILNNSCGGPEDILASVAAKEEQILNFLQEMQELFAGGNVK